MKAPGSIRDSTALQGDLFLSASNSNSYDVSNATFDDRVKLYIMLEVLSFSALRLKNSTDLSLYSL